MESDRALNTGSLLYHSLGFCNTTFFRLPQELFNLPVEQIRWFFAPGFWFLATVEWHDHDRQNWVNGGQSHR